MNKHALNEKKQWQKPKLIVLGRGKAEESVLTACKGNGSPSTKNAKYDGCRWEGNCYSGCSFITAS